MTERTSGLIVFAGPTLPRDTDAEWRALLAGCELRPPAQRGDILSALADHPRTIVLLDGYYFTVPSVPHKELLYALDAGVRVLGAASLGALRAAELATFGMVGVGTVFEWYRTGALEGDDEVALLHAPAEQGYRPITLALVDVRYALAQMTAAGTITPEAADNLIMALKELSFLDRHSARVAELARRHLGEPAAGDLSQALSRESLKQKDARLALRLAQSPESQRPAPRARPIMKSRYLGLYQEAALRLSPAGPPLLHACRMVQLFHPEAPACVRQIRLRSLLVAAALGRELEVPPATEQRLAASLRRHHEELFGRPVLAQPEYLEEARCHALAAEACRSLGGQDSALAALAEMRGLCPKTSEEDLLRLLATRSDSLAGWSLVRALTFSPAFPAAIELAAAAGEIHRCFQRRAEGLRVAWDDLRRLAVRLWSCPPEKVEEEGARRALFQGSSLSEGLRKALELVIAAERLPQPINDYPEKRDLLMRSPLSSFCSVSPRTWT